MNIILGFLEQVLITESPFIFLGGVHGVGKTTLCDQVFVPYGYRCVTASSLIKVQGFRFDQNKRVESVADNQIVLMEQLVLEKQHHDRLLLDGHYCLINSKNQFEPIDIEVFRKMSPDILIMLKDSPDKIVRRLKNRDGNGKEWGRSFVEQFQEIEEKHAQHIAHELNIPLQIISNDEDNS